MQLEPLSRIGILDANRSDMGGVVAFFRPKSQDDDRKVLHEGFAACVSFARMAVRSLST